MQDLSPHSEHVFCYANLQLVHKDASFLTLDSMVPSSIFLARNMELSMPLSMEGGGNASSIPSMIVSAQVNERGSTLMDIAETPVKLMFQFSKMENVTDDQYRCAYWKFSDP